MGRRNKKIYEICDVTQKKDLARFRENYLIFRMDYDYGRKHIKIEEEQVKEFMAQEKLRGVYMKHSDKICINQEKIGSDQLAALCNFGSSLQKQNITQVELVGNGLETVENILKLFPNVTTLNLSDNKLRDFRVFEKLTSLENVTLDSNYLEVLPQQVMAMMELKELSAAKNLIREVPVGIGQLRELKSLCLNRNRIETLPKELGKLQLVSLNLSDN
jgi:hypothetical protein